jgi:hypothetical protein
MLNDDSDIMFLTESERYMYHDEFSRIGRKSDWHKHFELFNEKTYEISIIYQFHMNYDVQPNPKDFAHEDVLDKINQLYMETRNIIIYKLYDLKHNPPKDQDLFFARQTLLRSLANTEARLNYQRIEYEISGKYKTRAQIEEEKKKKEEEKIEAERQRKILQEKMEEEKRKREEQRIEAERIEVERKLKMVQDLNKMIDEAEEKDERWQHTKRSRIEEEEETTGLVFETTIPFGSSLRKRFHNFFGNSL